MKKTKLAFSKLNLDKTIIANLQVNEQVLVAGGVGTLLTCPQPTTQTFTGCSYGNCSKTLGIGCTDTINDCETGLCITYNCQ